MFDPLPDRLLTYRRAVAYDCWGNLRHLRVGSRAGVWYADATNFDEPSPTTIPPEDRAARRRRQLAVLQRAVEFTPTELRTIQALVDGVSVAEIAARDGCSRQAVIARLVGNSRHQGGLIRKVARLRAHRLLGNTTHPE